MLTRDDGGRPDELVAKHEDVLRARREATTRLSLHRIDYAGAHASESRACQPHAGHAEREHEVAPVAHARARPEHRLAASSRSHRRARGTHQASRAAGRALAAPQAARHAGRRPPCRLATPGCHALAGRRPSRRRQRAGSDGRHTGASFARDRAPDVRSRGPSTAGRARHGGTPDAGAGAVASIREEKNGAARRGEAGREVGGEMAGEDEQGLWRRSGAPEHASWGCSARLGRVGWAGGGGASWADHAGSPKGRGRNVGRRQAEWGRRAGLAGGEAPPRPRRLAGARARRGLARGGARWLGH
jgi:hypothetical protein